MKKIVILLIILVNYIIEIQAQDEYKNCVKWQIETVNISENEFCLNLYASIDVNWILFSINNPEGGCRPTEIIIDS